jgi:bleomycin hydrolase
MTSYADGGQWDMLLNLVGKYGVVPKQAMPETYHSEGSRVLNYIVSTKLRQGAATLRRLHREGLNREALAGRKRDMVAELYGLFCQSYGEPPQSFTWEFTDKDGNYQVFSDLTPLAFYRRFVTLPLQGRSA